MTFKQPLTKKSFVKKAFDYLYKFPTTAYKLEQHLHKYADKKEYDDPDRQELIEQAIKECQKHGFLNDALFAQNRILHLLKKGKSLVFIEHDMQNYGLSQDHIDQAYNVLEEEFGDLNEFAFEKYISKKSITTNWSSEHFYEKETQKLIQKISRQGFPISMIKKKLFQN